MVYIYYSQQISMPKFSIFEFLLVLALTISIRIVADCVPLPHQVTRKAEANWNLWIYSLPGYYFYALLYTGFIQLSSLTKFLPIEAMFQLQYYRVAIRSRVRHLVTNVIQQEFYYLLKQLPSQENYCQSCHQLFRI